MRGNQGDVNKLKKETEHDVEFAKGGDTPMFGEQESDTAEKGETGKEDDRGPGDKYATGGKTKMFGYTPSLPAKSGITSAR